jgi:YD repeat-containing protein
MTRIFAGRFTTDTDDRITRYQVGSTPAPGATLDRSLAWIGDTVTAIIDNRNPGTIHGQYGSQSQSFAYTYARRLASAEDYYGSLASVTPAGGTARSFGYDASGEIIADTRTGVLGMSFDYDPEGRLSRAYQTNAPAQGEPHELSSRRSKVSAYSRGDRCSLYMYPQMESVVTSSSSSRE